MLYVYFGNDVTRVRQEAFDVLHTLREEGTVVTHLTHDLYQEGIIRDLSQGSSLFGTKQIVIIDSFLEAKEVFESMLDDAELMSASENHFIVIEGSLTAPYKKKLQPHTERFEEHVSEKKEKFNPFLLTEAFMRKDKKSLWLLLTEAWKEGLSNEEIIGIIFWQIKILRLVERTKSADEAGQKPFVYTKAKHALTLFKKGELDALSHSLLVLYHEGHGGKVTIETELEKWCLGV